MTLKKSFRKKSTRRPRKLSKPVVKQVKLIVAKATGPTLLTYIRSSTVVAPLLVNGISGQFVNLTDQIVTGPGVGTRLGNSITYKSLQLQMCINATTAFQKVRVMIFKFHGDVTSAPIPIAQDLIEAGFVNNYMAPWAPREREKLKSFSVVYDKMYQIQNTVTGQTTVMGPSQGSGLQSYSGNANKFVKKTIKLSGTCEFIDGGTPTNGQTKDSLWMFLISDDLTPPAPPPAVPNPTVYYWTQLNYLI